MIRCFRMIAGLLFFFYGSASACQEDKQEPAETDVRRFANVAEWAMQGSSTRDRLVNRIHQISAQADLPSGTVSKLLRQIDKVLKAFVQETAIDWASRQDRSGIADETKIIKRSVAPILKSRALAVELDEFLTEAQRTVWNEKSKAFERSDQLSIQSEAERAKAQKLRREVRSLLRSAMLRRPRFEDPDQPPTADSLNAMRDRLRKVIKASKDATKHHYLSLLAELDARVVLTDKQSARLKLATNGVAHRTHKSIERALEDTLSKETYGELIIALRRFEQASVFQATQLDPIFWKKAVDGTLTLVQKKRLDG